MMYKFYIFDPCLLFCFLQKTCEPHMCAYKLVTVEFVWWGLQSVVESWIQKVSPDKENASNIL